MTLWNIYRRGYILLSTASLVLMAVTAPAQADPATERALQLSEPLSTRIQVDEVKALPADDVLSSIIAEGSSAAMADARLKLSAQQQEPTNIAMSESAQQLAHNAIH